MERKKIVFVTGTRADFGKLKSLISASIEIGFECCIYITGMHLLSQYGSTYLEVEQSFKDCLIYKHANHSEGDKLDTILCNTCTNFSNFTGFFYPDVVFVHGDRVEALGVALSCALNNIHVAHIEGGEVSGTIDESIRHSVSKLSHTHFVCNQLAKQRLKNMGEQASRVHVIGSPDLDFMNSKNLPSLSSVLEHYQIMFNDFAISLYHPVTTSPIDQIRETNEYFNFMDEYDGNILHIFPNNDPGSSLIIDRIKRVCTTASKRHIYFPSVRFESFLVLLKNSSFIIGNSSAGVREAPYYGVPSVNVGNRQSGRANALSIIDSMSNTASLFNAVDRVKFLKPEAVQEFGDGKASDNFKSILESEAFWKFSPQKVFIDNG